MHDRIVPCGACHGFLNSYTCKYILLKESMMNLCAREFLRGRRMTWRPWQEQSFEGFLGLIVKVVILAIAYFATTRLGYKLAYLNTGISAIWPAIGVAVAGLVLFGKTAWPGIAIGGFLARLSTEPSLATAAGTTVAGVLAPLLAAWLLERYGLDPALTRLRDVLALVVLGGAASSLLSATSGTIALTTTGGLTAEGLIRGNPVLVWLAWWVIDAMGVVLVAPLLLTFGAAARLRTNPFQHRGVEMAMVIMATAIASRVLFAARYPVIFLVFPFVLWAALRLGLPGVATVNMLVAGMAVWATIERQGPFSQLPPGRSLLVLQSFNASVAITALVLAAVTAERKRALKEVRASRARLVEAADAERRRVERNLHDGAQQRLVSLSLTLRLAEAQLGVNAHPELQTTLTQAAEELKLALLELRELARGIFPTILTQEGLGAAVEWLAEQASLPVKVIVDSDRYPAAVEATGYFVVCEALTNVAKYAQASAATVSAERVNGRLIVEVSDDGAGGADPARGSGLSGLADRVAALGGELRIDSPLGRGTRVSAELPCG